MGIHPRFIAETEDRRMTRAFILPAALAAFALAAPSAAAAQDTLANDAKSAAYEMGEIAQAAEFFSQDEFLIVGGQVRWVDEQRAVPPVALPNTT